MNDAQGIGFYGKLPSKGDFVTRRLSRGFIDKWDGWLQQAIAHSKGVLGENWLDIYMTSPIWNFVMTPGVCGARGWGGAMIPSVDRVGRYFPLTIAGSLGTECDPLGMAMTAPGWFKKTRNVALLALEDGANAFDDFELAVASLGEPRNGMESMPKAHADPFTISQDWMIPLVPGAGVVSCAATLFNQILVCRYERYSIWWTEGSEYVAPRMLVCRGLPPAESYASLISGQPDTENFAEPLDMPCPVVRETDIAMLAPESAYSEILTDAASTDEVFETEETIESAEPETIELFEPEAESPVAVDPPELMRDEMASESIPQASAVSLSPSASSDGIVSGARPLSIDDFFSESDKPPLATPKNEDSTVPRADSKSFSNGVNDSEAASVDDDSENANVPADEAEDSETDDANDDTWPGDRHGGGSE